MPDFLGARRDLEHVLALVADECGLGSPNFRKQAGTFRAL
jgi:hypothetical protein